MSMSARTWAFDMTARPRLRADGAPKPGESELFKPLSPVEKLILVTLADLENPELGYAFPTLQTIADKACCTKEYARRVVEKFERAGLIVIAQKRMRGAIHANNRYMFPAVPAEIRERDQPWMSARERNGDPLDDAGGGRGRTRFEVALPAVPP